MNISKTKNVPALIGFIILAQLAGVIGSVFTSGSVDTWYPALNKPSFTPPSWLFGPVWITLFTLMGISAYLIWRKGWANPQVKSSLRIFFFQLILNALWSILFFGLHWLSWAFVEIAALWLLILLMILKFRKISPAAGYLQIPYLLWVTFAGILNLSIWILNV
jgi:translocator protein